MEHIFNTEEFQLKNTVVCLGKFDGIHRGHRLLIDTVLAYSNLTSVVFTFALHPSTLFSKQEAQLIDTTEEKVEKISGLGVDVLVSYPFTEKTAAMDAEEFVKTILVEKLDAKVIVVGKDFHFGHQRKGNVQVLKKYAAQYGYEVIALEKLESDHHVVSSTRIRGEIKKGNMEKVEELMGAPYGVTGIVLHGQQLGRTIGMPTINQAVPDNKIIPPKGVYVSCVYLDGKKYGGITNIGTKPTVSGKKELGVETYILDFSGDLYGQNVRVEFLSFVRPEKKFPSFELLKEQMKKDLLDAKKCLEKRKNCFNV